MKLKVKKKRKKNVMRDNKVHLDSGCKLEVRSTANGSGIAEGRELTAQK